jgi:hypothetical protein
MFIENTMIKSATSCYFEYSYNCLYGNKYGLGSSKSGRVPVSQPSCLSIPPPTRNADRWTTGHPFHFSQLTKFPAFPSITRRLGVIQRPTVGPYPKPPESNPQPQTTSSCGPVEEAGSWGNVLDSCSGSARRESRWRYRLQWLRLSVVFLRSSNAGIVLWNMSSWLPSAPLSFINYPSIRFYRPTGLWTVSLKYRRAHKRIQYLIIINYSTMQWTIFCDMVTQ